MLALKITLEAGDWEVRSRLLIDKNMVSEWSNPRVFKVIITGITLGNVNIKFAFLTLIIITLLLFGVIGLAYFIWRVKRLKTMLVTKEISEAQESVREGLGELRKDLLDELRILGYSGKKLSGKELVRKEHILRELEKIEHNMEREIQDIAEKI